MPRRLLLAAFSLAAVAILIAAPSAFADAITPESGGSPNADDIDTLYKLTLYIGIAIFLLVEGTLIWSLVKYRARRGGTADQIRGNTPLEIGWTVGAATILVVLTVVVFLYLDEIESPPASGPNGLQRASEAQFASVDQPNPPTSGGPVMRIHVNGQQYIWRYDYPGDPGALYSYEEMVVPTNTTVVLELEASDVIHSWWIPKFGPKADAVPGYVNKTWFKVAQPGTYRGQCAELCGSGHADMRAQVVAMSPDRYEQWAQNKREEIQAAGEELAAQRKQRQGSAEE